MNENTKLESLAKEIRRIALGLVYKSKSSHIGGAFSMADLLAVLYEEFIQISPDTLDHPLRDRFILSKGHACTSLYAVLALKGFFPMSDFDNYAEDGNSFLTHATHYVPGVELSAGSLGHGLSVACGLALGARSRGENWKTYCLVSDGEMDEGSNWEAILFAGHHHLSGLCLLIDYNKIQSLGFTHDIIDLEPLAEKMRAFQWNVIEIDGHNYSEIRNALKKARDQHEKPTVIIANTIKGKGVSFMENKLLWHYRNPDEEQYKSALRELMQ